MLGSLGAARVAMLRIGATDDTRGRGEVGTLFDIALGGCSSIEESSLSRDAAVCHDSPVLVLWSVIDTAFRFDVVMNTDIGKTLGGKNTSVRWYHKDDKRYTTKFIVRMIPGYSWHGSCDSSDPQPDLPLSTQALRVALRGQ